MLATFNKYYAAFTVGLQSNLVYRVNFAVRGFFAAFARLKRYLRAFEIALKISDSCGSPVRS